MVVEGPVAKSSRLKETRNELYHHVNSKKLPPLRPNRVSITLSIVSELSGSAGAAAASWPQSTSTRSSEPVSSAESSL